MPPPTGAQMRRTATPPPRASPRKPECLPSVCLPVCLPSGLETSVFRLQARRADRSQPRVAASGRQTSGDGSPGRAAEGVAPIRAPLRAPARANLLTQTLTQTL